ncbi:hypothetical protein BH11VER1_BH11VER1_07040 [soil metagenome]
MAEDLALPVNGNAPVRIEEPKALAPNATIRPPSKGPVTVAAPTKQQMAEKAILEMERQLIAAEARRQLTESQLKGNTIELKQLIVVNGPMDTALSNAPKPPAAADGKVALIGLPNNEKATKSLEGFFGAPMTAESEKKLLETVRSQFASSKEMANMEVSIAGWWPEQGVMAVSLAPKG